MKDADNETPHLAMSNSALAQNFWGLQDILYTSINLHQPDKKIWSHYVKLV